MSEAEPEVETIAELLADETARTILAQTSIEPLSARRLVERCDASGPTVYRRLERLREADLVVEQTVPDPDEGHHRSEYAPNLRQVVIDLDSGSFSLQVDRAESMPDRFTRLIEEI